ncbi:MAG: NAD(+)/NADH kinase [Bryobacter sp.]|nr:NAD(+)/NADH kinase [Bryobacter sp.]
MAAVKVVGIFSKPDVDRAAEVVPRLMQWLTERNIVARLDAETSRYLGKENGIPREDIGKGADLVIVLGGDGTLLSAARAIHGLDVPVFPVNLGSLGFLTAITTEELYVELERALSGESRIAKRRLLSCEVHRGAEKLSHYEALNDVVVTKAALARMIDLDVTVDHHFVCSYKADGLIVTTPTGSTAYSLSAGGPILFPSVPALCITPICPHMLTNRPVIVPDESIITLHNHAQDDAYLTVDGQVGEPLHYNDRVVCRSSGHSLRLVRPPRLRFFDVLRQKLKWGER